MSENVIRQYAGHNPESFDPNLLPEDFSSFINFSSVGENLWIKEFSFGWFLKLMFVNFFIEVKRRKILGTVLKSVLIIWIQNTQKMIILVICESFAFKIQKFHTFSNLQNYQGCKSFWSKFQFSIYCSYVCAYLTFI